MASRAAFVARPLAIHSSSALARTTFVLARWQSTDAGSKPEEAKQPETEAAAPVDPKDAQIKALQEEVAKLKSQTQELNSARLRVLAEMENVRAIAKRDVAQSKDYALQSFAKALLDTADNLHRAVESVPAEAREKRPGNEAMANLYEGVSATERNLVKVLGQHGIVQFGAAGEAFDYNKHEALMQLPAGPGTPPNTVAQVLKTGYMLKDRVIRVCQVATAVGQ